MFCECDGCDACNLQAKWWAELTPFLPFEANGLIHVTNVEGYAAACGGARLRMQGLVTMTTVYTEVARALSKAVTCIGCAARHSPEGFL